MFVDLKTLTESPTQHVSGRLRSRLVLVMSLCIRWPETCTLHDRWRDCWRFGDGDQSRPRNLACFQCHYRKTKDIHDILDFLLWGKFWGWATLKQELLNVLVLCCPEQTKLVDLWQSWPSSPGWSPNAGLELPSRKSRPLRTSCIVLTENKKDSFACSQPQGGASL